MHGYDPAREEMESEWNAHYDYLREAYGPTADDARRFAEDEFEAYEREHDELERSEGDLRLGMQLATDDDMLNIVCCVDQLPGYAAYDGIPF